MGKTNVLARASTKSHIGSAYHERTRNEYTTDYMPEVTNSFGNISIQSPTLPTPSIEEQYAPRPRPRAPDPFFEDVAWQSARGGHSSGRGTSYTNTIGMQPPHVSSTQQGTFGYSTMPEPSQPSDIHTYSVPIPAPSAMPIDEEWELEKQRQADAKKEKELKEERKRQDKKLKEERKRQDDVARSRARWDERRANAQRKLAEYKRGYGLDPRDKAVRYARGKLRHEVKRAHDKGLLYVKGKEPKGEKPDLEAWELEDIKLHAGSVDYHQR